MMKRRASRSTNIPSEESDYNNKMTTAAITSRSTCRENNLLTLPLSFVRWTLFVAPLVSSALLLLLLLPSIGYKVLVTALLIFVQTPLFLYYDACLMRRQQQRQQEQQPVSCSGTASSSSSNREGTTSNTRTTSQKQQTTTAECNNNKSKRSRNIILSRSKIMEAIVNEHFPESVQERLQQVEQQDEDDDKENHEQEQEPPIIDEYPEVTVLFADIAGFTRWSSDKTSTQVLWLLQTLYKEFDHLAKHHGVYKVETVGDAYLAMAGAPYADPNHAKHMAKFALDMQSVAQRILPKDDDSNKKLLDLRIGLHTGPITTGVLVGCTKPRYQIFGDTVNTASRMETLCLPGKIQISESTKRALEHTSCILIPRNGVVLPKGKGPMQTFWLEDYSSSSSSSNRCKRQKKRWSDTTPVSDTAATVASSSSRVVPPIPKKQHGGSFRRQRSSGHIVPTAQRPTRNLHLSNPTRSTSAGGGVV